MNLSDQNNGNVLKQGAHTEGGLENVYPPAHKSGAAAHGDGADVALAEVDLADQTEVHALHDSRDGPATGHHEHDTHRITGSTPIPTLDLDVATFGESAFPLDGQGPGQGEDTQSGHPSSLSIDLPLDDDAPAAESTLSPDPAEAPATRLLDAEPAQPESVAPSDDDDTGIPLIGRRSIGYQQRFVVTLALVGLAGLVGTGFYAFDLANAHGKQITTSFSVTSPNQNGNPAG